MSDVTCPICGSQHEGMYRHAPLAGVSAPDFDERVAFVCGRCADAIANLHALKHSGVPITWPYVRDAGVGYIKERIPQALRWEVFRRDGFSCLSCGSQSDLTADHIHPEKLGGEATIENLRTLCRSCNSKKGART